MAGEVSANAVGVPRCQGLSFRGAAARLDADAVCVGLWRARIAKPSADSRLIACALDAARVREDALRKICLQLWI